MKDWELARNHFALNFCHCFGFGSDAVRTWFGRGSHVVRMWFGCGSGVGRMWFGRVFGSGADSLAEVKGKWFPARELGFLKTGNHQIHPNSSAESCHRRAESDSHENGPCFFFFYCLCNFQGKDPEFRKGPRFHEPPVNQYVLVCWNYS